MNGWVILKNHLIIFSPIEDPIGPFQAKFNVLPLKHIVFHRRSAFEMTIFAIVLPLIMGTKEVLHSCLVPCIWLKLVKIGRSEVQKPSYPPYFD